MLKVAFREEYVHPLPDNHRFPMEKYDLLPKQLIHEGTLVSENFFIPGQMDKDLILRIHDGAYIDRLFALQLTEREQRVSGFPHSKALIERESYIMEGTRQCAEWALLTGAAMNIAGGTHHAYTNRGEGFCLMNDQALAARWLLDEGLVNKILIIDLDVHQGNGTAEIFSGEPNVFTFSMHGENNYPLKKEFSDLDVGLPDGIRDKDYLLLLERSLEDILKKFQPEFIFYQCGVDIIETDKLGRLGVSILGCRERDRIIFNMVRQLEIPVVCSMGGGYSKDIRHIIEAHANTYRSLQEILF